MVQRLDELGVNELAYFIDFGAEVSDVLDGLNPGNKRNI